MADTDAAPALADDGHADDSPMTDKQHAEFVGAHHVAAAEHLAQAAPHLAALLGRDDSADDAAASDTDSPGVTDAGEASRTFTATAPAYSAQARGRVMGPGARIAFRGATGGRR